VLAILDDLVKTRDMGLIFISHDLNLVSTFCDRVLVMYAGQIMEELDAKHLNEAKHPYTRGLLACTPSLDKPVDVLPTLQRDPSWMAPVNR
jgi:peptide/nickel transport system ATP-binding protein